MPRTKKPAPDDLAAQEVDQQQRAASPLSLHFEAISCEFATIHEVEGRIVPRYSFHQPCIVGKTVPDQDCRTCPHHRIARVGMADKSGAQRYFHAGLTVAVSEEQAGRVLGMLAKDDTLPLSRPHWQAHHQAQTDARAAQEATHAVARELERQQSSPHSMPRRTEG